MEPYRPRPRGGRRTSLAAALSPFYQRAVGVVTSLQRRCATALYESAKAAIAKKIDGDDDAEAGASARFSSSVVGMDLLPDDAVRTIAEYAGKLYGAEAYVRFAQTCRRTSRLLLSPGPDGRRENRTIRNVIERRSRASHRRPPSAPASAPYGIRSLEQLALFERWRDADFLRDNRIVFPFGSTKIEPEIQARILKIVDILVRHPRASLRLDAHCGTAAPNDGIADWFSRARGLSVLNAICYVSNAFIRHARVDQGRVSVVGWGKRAANAVVQSGHPFRDVAGEGRGWVEACLEVPGRREGDGEMVLPPRHQYYQGFELLSGSFRIH